MSAARVARNKFRQKRLPTDTTLTVLTTIERSLKLLASLGGRIVALFCVLLICLIASAKHVAGSQYIVTATALTLLLVLKKDTRAKSTAFLSAILSLAGRRMKGPPDGII
jgi:hypothetical protein